MQIELEGMAYAVHININQWKEALVSLDVLEALGKANPDKKLTFGLDKVLSERAWIFYSFVEEWPENERKQIIINA